MKGIQQNKVEISIDEDMELEAVVHWVWDNLSAKATDVFDTTRDKCRDLGFSDQDAVKHALLRAVVCESVSDTVIGRLYPKPNSRFAGTAQVACSGCNREQCVCPSDGIIGYVHGMIKDQQDQMIHGLDNPSDPHHRRDPDPDC